MATGPVPELAHPTTFLVVFEDRPRHGLFRLLRPGFRHCFCLRRERAGWLLCDPRSDRLDLRLVPPVPALALARAYAGLGGTVLALRLATGAFGPIRRPRLPAPFTCVEVVARLLGLGPGRARTPWDLFRRLAERPETVFLAPPRVDGWLTEEIGRYT